MFFVVIVICGLITKILQMKTGLASMMPASTMMFEEQQFLCCLSPVFFVIICGLITKILQMKTKSANMMSASTAMFEEQQLMMMIAFL